jgi:hypothetical protein
MSVEINVLSDSRLDSIASWQRSLDAEGLPLRLAHDVLFDEDGGTLTAHLHDRPTSFQCWIEDPADLMSTYKNINFGHSWKYVVTFPWIAGFDELIAVWMAATAYARATGGVVFDEQEGKLLTADESLQVVHDIERDLPQAEELARRLDGS